MESKDIRLYYFHQGKMRKVGPGTTLYKIGHRHKSVTRCKDAIDEHKLVTNDRNTRTVQFIIVEYTGILEAKIIEVLEKKYRKNET